MKTKLMIIALVALLAFVLMPVQAASWIWPAPGIAVNGTNVSAANNLNHTGSADSAFYVVSGTADSSHYWYHYEDYGAWIQWENPLGQYYSMMRLDGWENTLWTCNGVNVIVPETGYVNVSISGDGPIRCENESYYYARLSGMQIENGTPPPPIANFTGAPRSGAAPLYVMLDDTSENEYGTCTYNWTLTPAAGISAGATGTLENHAASFSVPGNYTVVHGVSCDVGSNTSTKTDYITVYNATTDYITTAFAAMDSPRWVQLAGATMNLLDIENGSWVNATPSATGYLEITTLSNHTINAYASMLGYDDADLLAQPAWGGGVYKILMYPENYGNVSAGNVTLYVTVYGSDVEELSGAEVEVTWDPWAENIKQSVTDSSGMVSFVVPNQTTIYIAAEKQGYTGFGTSMDSGNGDGGSAAIYKEITLQRNYLTPTATQTTLPGGGTPTPAVTILPGCEDPDSPECTAARQQFMADDVTEQLMEFMPLFWLAILIGLVKLIFKGW